VSRRPDLPSSRPSRLTPPISFVVEVWKFGFYTLFPLATLYYFSDDDWYNKHVVPVSVELVVQRKG
jgi:hypothetical protein